MEIDEKNCKYFGNGRKVNFGLLPYYPTILAQES